MGYLIIQKYRSNIKKRPVPQQCSSNVKMKAEWNNVPIFGGNNSLSSSSFGLCSESTKANMTSFIRKKINMNIQQKRQIYQNWLYSIIKNNYLRISTILKKILSYSLIGIITYFFASTLSKILLIKVWPQSQVFQSITSVMNVLLSLKLYKNTQDVFYVSMLVFSK